MTDKTLTTEEDKRRTRSLSKGYVDLIVELRNKPDTVFDVVIVGSGYGGSIAAQQLAGLKDESGKALKIALLERGSEYLPGMFPSTFADLPGHVRFGRQNLGTVTGELEGLFDFRLGNDVNALVANGLGGGSLINAGVLKKPDFESLKLVWPKKLIENLTKADTDFFDQARKLLLTEPLNLLAAVKNTVQRPRGVTPEKFLRLKELSQFSRKDELETEFEPAEITIAASKVDANKFGIKLNACVACGDCMTGCNVGAKASLNTNLLAQAERDRVEIYTGASVLSLKRDYVIPNKLVGEKIWSLEVVHTSPALRIREAKPLSAADSTREKHLDHSFDDKAFPVILKTKKVILAAGTFGSTEILLRSRSASLSFSNKLGERFSCNGDNIAAISGLNKVANCSADEDVGLKERSVGPTITGSINVSSKDPHSSFLIQEFAIPAPLKRLYEEAVTTSAVIAKLPTFDSGKHGNESDLDLDPLAVDKVAINETLMLGLIGHDEAKGVLRLPVQTSEAGTYEAQEGALQIVWPEARNGKQIDSAFDRLKELSSSAFKGSRVVANPMWRLLPTKLEKLITQPRGPVLTVHPLGGCSIGDAADSGVVNEYGCVFNTGDPTDKWEGSLLVLDGSIIPSSLGANPALTISAVALRAILECKKRWKWGALTDEAALSKEKHLDKLDTFADFNKEKTPPTKATKVAITERLVGAVCLARPSAVSEKYVHPEGFILEITLKYQYVELQKLMKSWGGRQLVVEASSYLQLFKQSEWDDGLQLRVGDEAYRKKHAIWTASLTGKMKFFHRDKNCAITRMKSLLFWIVNRGARDTIQEIAKYIKNKTTSNKNADKSEFRGIGGRFMDALRLSSRAGEVRLFEYDLSIGKSLNTNTNTETLTKYFANEMANKVIKGHKRLTYNRRANPWTQMTELTVTKMPLMALSDTALLKLDGSFVAKKGIPLIEIVQQENHANALLDMASFGLFMTRLLLNIHIWTFRKPDELTESEQNREPQRLPEKIAGLPDPEIIELSLSANKRKENTYVRLMRYKGGQQLRKEGKIPHPIALIHGYSVSGNTFTHASLNISTAEYLWRNQIDGLIDGEVPNTRDIWVIDLRTSSGMPTAKRHWSFEEVALVDIPAALLHIKTVTGRTVDVLAHCIGAPMLSMAILTRASDVKSDKVQLGVDTWITEAQLGTLNAFNGVNEQVGSREKHPTINSIVLSQKGPLLRYTDANIFRAYLMQSLRRLLLPDNYQFKPSKNPGVTEQILDRLLYSLPYPKQDYDVENPCNPFARTPWTGTRHRMDALFARDFNAENLSDQTLNSIDDLFGPINLDTVSQTIQFVRFNRVTNQRGRGEFVTQRNLRERWGNIPTFAIHGQDNGLVDVSSQELLELNFKAAGVPFAKKTFTGFGHQDVFIGIDSHIVFKELKEFFDAPLDKCKNLGAAVKTPNLWRFARPWLGPRLDLEACTLDSKIATIFAKSSPNFGEATLLLIPVSKNKCIYQISGTVLASLAGDSDDWLSIAMPTSIGGNEKWLAVIAYRIEDTTFAIEDVAFNAVTNDGVNRRNFAQNKTLAKDDLLEIDAAFLVKKDEEKFTEKYEVEINRWLSTTEIELDRLIVNQSDFEKLAPKPKTSFNFVLGSCQYPGGIFDKKLSEKSMDAIANQISDIDFVVFAGDQIYVDATAGLLDPTRRDERFDAPYENAFRVESLRKIMRHVPVHMMLDDHELSDNWEPPHPSKENEKYLKTTARQKRYGMTAYWKYQRLRNFELGELPEDRDVSYEFSHADAVFYMLDTRSKRVHREIGNARRATFWSKQGAPMENELDMLCYWLAADVNKEKIKFIVTSSILLPRKLSALNVGADHTSRCDSWEGYPSMMQQIFKCILDNNIQNTVFLSGDEHLSCHAKVTLSDLKRPTKKPIVITSVHASGLYAPFPFANAKQNDFVTEVDTFQLGTVLCCVKPHFAHKDTRFAKIRVVVEGGQPAAVVEYHGHHGKIYETMNLLA